MSRNWYPPDCVKESKKRKPIQVDNPKTSPPKKLPPLPSIRRRKHLRVQASISAAQAQARKTLKKVMKPDRRRRIGKVQSKFLNKYNFSELQMKLIKR